MEKPNYQITASPISTFTSFGAPAPTAGPTVEGAPAAPIDQWSPTMEQLGRLSNTFSEILRIEQAQQDRAAMAETTASFDRVKAIEEGRKGNMLTYADMVDKGIIKGSENPWAKVAGMRALAELSLDQIQLGLKGSLENDFLTNEQLSNPSEPDVEFAKYMEGKMNPLQFGKGIMGDYYFSSHFEKGFAELRQTTQLKLVEMREKKIEMDTISSIQSRVADAINFTGEGLESIPFKFGTLTFDPKEMNVAEASNGMVEFVMADTLSRAVLGNRGVVDTVGFYLIDLAKQGNLRALSALETVKISNGQTLLQASDAVNAEFNASKGTIRSATQRKIKIEYKQWNRDNGDRVKSQLSGLFRISPTMSNADIASQLSAVEWDRTTNRLQWPVQDSEGKFYLQDIPSGVIEDIRKRSTDRHFELLYQQHLNQNMSPEMALANALENMPSDETGKRLEVNAALNIVAEGVNEIDVRYRDLDDDERAAANSKIHQSLMFYRAASTDLRGQYFTDEQRAKIVLLDLMERNLVPDIGPSTSESGVRDYSSIMDAIDQYEGSAGIPSTHLSTFTDTVLLSDLPDSLKPQIITVGEIVMTLDPNIEADELADSMLGSFAISGNNYSMRMGQSVHGVDNIETAVDYLVNNVVAGNDAGGIVDTVHHVLNASGLLVDDDAFDEDLFKVVSSPDPGKPESLDIMYGLRVLVRDITFGSLRDEYEQSLMEQDAPELRSATTTEDAEVEARATTYKSKLYHLGLDKYDFEMSNTRIQQLINTKGNYADYGLVNKSKIDEEEAGLWIRNRFLEIANDNPQWSMNGRAYIEALFEFKLLHPEWIFPWQRRDAQRAQEDWQKKADELEREVLENIMNRMSPLGPFSIGSSVLKGFDHLQGLVDIYNGPNTRTDGWGPKEIPGNQP
mgnify:CR=1 FL=1|tara:strand:- start:11239 stop:13959 length:2721 start_codon:yes stop_codon:yes gene_type:complete